MAQIGRYEIIEELGRGGFATVYKAQDTQLKRMVALKVLHAGWSGDPEFVHRFQQEAEVSAGFSHPNIVTVYDVGEIERQLFIAMEFLPGQNLQQWMHGKGRPLTVAESLTILRPLADALDYAHQQGVVHRDIKPGNVMILETNGRLRVVLTDFGLVKAMENSIAVTKTGQTLGSPEYMAPEQADPNRQDEVGPHTDLYAFGIIAYQMLTGRVPFPGNSISTLFAHANLDVPPPQEINPELPEEIAAALMRLLSKDPAARYPTATAFTDALQDTIQADGRSKSLQAQVDPLYTRLEQAKAAADWVEVLALATQIEAILPGYRDVDQLQAEARQQLQPSQVKAQPQEGKTVVEKQPEDETLLEAPSPEAELPPPPPLKETVAADVPSEPAPIAPEQKVKTRPKYIWAVGGIAGIVLVAFLLFVLPQLMNGSDNSNDGVDAVARLPDENETEADLNTNVNETEAALDIDIEETEAALGTDVEETATTEAVPAATATSTMEPTSEPTPTPTIDPSVPPPNPTLGSSWIRPSDNMVMVYVPEGTFTMGSDPDSDPDFDEDELPQHEVTLDSFWIDQTEVTNEQYSMCVQAGSCEATSFVDDSSLNGDQQPVVGVSWFEADAYCTWAGVQLPTEAQWEYAARGDDGRIYTWGDDSPDCELAMYGNCGESTMTVGSFSPAGDSWVGAMDMLGNVWEWVADWYGSDYYGNSPDANPAGPEDGSTKVLRGGGWRISTGSLRVTNRGSHGAPDGKDIDVGFRCAMPAPE